MEGDVRTHAFCREVVEGVCVHDGYMYCFKQRRVGRRFDRGLLEVRMHDDGMLL